MASTFRYRRGDAKPVPMKTNSSFPIEAGDLLWQDPDDGTVKPAADLTNQGVAATNQDYFQQYFAGVAMGKVGLQTGETTARLTTDPGYVMVGTGGVWEFDCASAAFVPGALVGVKADGNGCSNQAVASAASESLAIGVAVPTVAQLGVAVTSIEVEIRSTIMRGSVQAQVAGSGSGQ